MTRREQAMENFLKGYNCCQSVALAFKDILDIDEETLGKISCSFGGGFSRLREVCGSVSGMCMVMSLLYGYSGPETGEVKFEQYARFQEVAKEFEVKNGSLICRELLNLDVKHDTPQASARTSDYYAKRPCKELIGDAAEILEKYINSHK